MKKRNWLILVLCLLILASATWIFLTLKQYRIKHVSSVSIKLDPLYNAIHENDYSEVEKIVKESPGVLSQLHALGGTYMNCAVSTKDTKMIRLLLKLGADANGAAGCGMAPLILACMYKDLEAVKILLEAGADPNVYGHATCPLTAAKESGNNDIAKLLMEHGAKEITLGPNGPSAMQAKP